MFVDVEKRSMLVRLYVKARAIGHIPSFEEINVMTNMPTANTYALHCRSYEDATRIVSTWLNASPTRQYVPEDSMKEMEVQDVRLKAGWIPITPRLCKKTLKELLDEVFANADSTGNLPTDYHVGYDLAQRIDNYYL